MNILFITHYGELYGSIRSLLDLTEGLRDYDISPHFLVPRHGSFTHRIEALGMPYQIMPVPWWMTQKPLSAGAKFRLADNLLNSARNVQRWAKTWDISLIYTNTSVTPVGRLAAQLTGLPHIWHIRELAELHFSFKFSLPRSLAIKIIKSSNAVICHSQVVKNFYFKKPEKKAHLVYNGTATHAQFITRLEQRHAQLPSSIFTFAMLSAIAPSKGQATAIRAMGSLKDKGFDAKLVIAGSGKPDYLQQLNQLVTDLEINDRVEFTGFVADPYPFYYASNCALICSEHEALSRVGLEAMSTALPLIGRNSGGNPEIIMGDKTGLLYNTFEELVDAMVALVQNTERARQMGLAGWKMAKERFNIEQYAAGVYRVIQSVMKEQA